MFLDREACAYSVNPDQMSDVIRVYTVLHLATMFRQISGYYNGLVKNIGQVW